MCGLRRGRGSIASTPRAQVTPTIVDLAWAAGFLEGEGSILYSGTDTHLDATQVNREPLENLQKLFGGTISSYRPKNVNHNEWYRWTVYGTRARGIAMTLYTWFSQKRRAQIRRILGCVD